MNLIYIHTHDTGRMISPYGHLTPTDHIMEFAKDATVFTNSFCVAPTCSPSRAGLLTGTYPHQNGMYGLAHRGFALDDYSRHLCQYLNSQGYISVLSGIQHESGFYLENTGADVVGYQVNLTDDATQYAKEDLYLWDEKNAQNAAQWIKDYQEDKPFMLSYGLHSTHRPFPDHIDDSIDPNYCKPNHAIVNHPDTRIDHAQLLTSLKYADNSFNHIIEALKQKGIYDDSIIIFTTDHGLPLPYAKCYLNDDGIGVTLIMRTPFAKTNGQVIDSLLSHIDVFPTLCDLLSLPKPAYLQGKSFANSFKGETVSNEYVFAEINFHTSYEPARCVRSDRYKYVRYYDQDYLKINPSNVDVSITRSLYIDEGWLKQTKDQEALYDLFFDPSEKNNCIHRPEYRDIVIEMRKVLLDFQVRTQDPILHGHFPIQNHYKVNKKDCLDPSSRNPQDYEEEGRTQ